MFRRFISKWKGWASGGVVGFLALWLFGPGPLGDRCELMSFDLPMSGHPTVGPDGVVLVYIDDASFRELQWPHNRTVDRRWHAALLKALRAGGARRVVFDVLFSDPDIDPRGDAAFLAELRLRPDTILAMKHTWTTESGGRSLVSTPVASNYIAGVGGRVGTTWFQNDSDVGVRKLPTAVGGVPALAELAAALDGKNPEAGERVRYLHYYGTQDRYPQISYAGVLAGRAPPGYFKDKVVFVGQRQKTASAGSDMDMFVTPYTRAGDGAAPGVLVHATAYLNRMRHESLAELGVGWEGLLWLGVLGISMALPVLSPLRSGAVAWVAIAGLVAGGYMGARSEHVWFPWLNISLVLVVGWIWAVAYGGVRQHVANRVLAESIGKHVSPRRVRQLLAQPEALQPGGRMLDVSVVFTDLEGFSKLAQRVPPSELMRELNAYYEKAISVVHAGDGTVMDLIGDAIFAIWNAPEPQEDHAERACRAALALAGKVGVFAAANGGVPMRTRIGVHRGPACVGNVGSKSRFDYTALGDAVNLASRLEGLNKQLGTRVLATHDIVADLQHVLVTRFIGQFRAKGSDRVFLVHELIRLRADGVAEEPWLEVFREGVRSFQNREWDRAVASFSRVVELRRDPDTRAGDGPSGFLLQRVARLRQEPPPDDWKGEMTLDEK